MFFTRNIIKFYYSNYSYHLLYKKNSTYIGKNEII